MQVVNRLNQETVQAKLQEYVAQGSTIQTDNFRIYARVYQNDYSHKGLFSKNLQATDLLKWVHVITSNAKSINGTYHGLDDKHLQAYLDEFCFRFNRRFGNHNFLIDC